MKSYNTTYIQEVSIDIERVVAQLSTEVFIQLVKNVESYQDDWKIVQALYKYFRDLRENMVEALLGWDDKEALNSPEFDNKYLLEDQIYDNEVYR